MTGVLDKTLTPKDAVHVLEKILPAKNSSRPFGLKLGLLPHEGDAIHSKHSDPQEQLFQVLLAFTNQTEPRPTWRAIIDALKSPVVKLPALAETLEKELTHEVGELLSSDSEEKGRGTKRKRRREHLEETDESLQATMDQELAKPLQELRQKKEELQSSEVEKCKVSEQLEKKQLELAEAQQKLTQKEEQLQLSEREKQRAEEELKLKVIDHQNILRQKEELLKTCEREKEELTKAQQELIKKDEKLKASEMEKEAVKQQLRKIEAELSEARQQLKQKDEKLKSTAALAGSIQGSSGSQQLMTQSDQATASVHQTRKLTLQCIHCANAPHAMERGSATVVGGFAYFTPRDSNAVYKYELNMNEWEKVCSCPFSNSGLVTMNSKLIAVGGCEGATCTNKLHALDKKDHIEIESNPSFSVKKVKKDVWVDRYTSMKKARSSPAVSAYKGDYLIVIGGFDDIQGLTGTVELLEVATAQWHQVADIPKPIPYPTATIMCQDLLCVIGDGPIGFTCSLQNLPKPDRVNYRYGSMFPKPVPSVSWELLPSLPDNDDCATPASLGGQLIVIRDHIHQLVGNKWVKIDSSLILKKTRCLVASVSPSKIVIEGGWSSRNKDFVETCSLV